MASSLPIDSHLDEIVRAVFEHKGAIVVAEPGAGKTTRVPTTLLDAMELFVTCTQPRRIAAQLAARHVARSRGTNVGDEIGYDVRFDKKCGENTRLRFVTEGIAKRQWLSKPPKNHILILDEFHERHLEGDILLALAKREMSRADFGGIVIMSATLDPQPLSEFLGGVPIIASQGRTYPVTIEYRPPRGRDSLEQLVARALREQHKLGIDGDTLVFLPGVAELKRCANHMSAWAADKNIRLVLLHGGLSRQQQDAALKDDERQTVIFATNVAETSLTLPKVTLVIDSGLARVARHSPWTGLKSLRTEPISQASAKQRAGRAGRTRAGTCVRLYSEHDLKTRRPSDLPEILRGDLATATLELTNNRTPWSALSWLTQPPKEAIDAAMALLAKLGAIQDDRCTKTGERMALLSLHPRLARVAIAAQEAGVAKCGARMVALLEERPLRHRTSAEQGANLSSNSDVLDDLDLLTKVNENSNLLHEARSLGINASVARNIIKSEQQILRQLKPRGDDASDGTEEALLLALLAGFPDRVARRVGQHCDTLLLCEGGQIRQSQQSAVTNAEYLIAIEVETHKKERGGPSHHKSMVRVCSAIDPSWLLDYDAVREVDEHVFDSKTERVVRKTGLYYGDIAIDEELIFDKNRLAPTVCRALLIRELCAGALVRIVNVEALKAHRARLCFASKYTPLVETAAADNTSVAETLVDACHCPSSLGELPGNDIVRLLLAQLSQDAERALQRIAPTHVSLPGRKRVVVHYELDRPPWIESRLQDFFGLHESPQVANGTVPLTLHLQAPNRRAVQVTNDLAGFWIRHYPALRKQLMRRYPRHSWPERPE